MAVLIILLSIMVSTILLYLSEKRTITIGKIKINNLLVWAALIITAVCAASRSVDSGGDSALYGDILFNGALSSDNWDSYYVRFHESYYSMEPLYLFLTYVVGLFTDNYHILFFVVSIIINYLIYDGICRLKNHFELEYWYAMLVFYLMFWRQSMNITRQCLALAVVFWGFRFIFEKKPYKYALVVIISMLFHISAAVAFALYPLYYGIQQRKMRRLVVGVIIILGLLFILQYAKVIDFLSGFNILPGKFFTVYSLSGTAWSPYALFTKMPLLAYFGYNAVRTRKMGDTVDWNNWYFVLLIALDIIISQLSGISTFLFRLALYFSYPSILFFASLKKRKERWWMLVYCLLFFYGQNIFYSAIPSDLFG